MAKVDFHQTMSVISTMYWLMYDEILDCLITDIVWWKSSLVMERALWRPVLCEINPKMVL